jgi:hypothetical protein
MQAFIGSTAAALKLGIKQAASVATINNAGTNTNVSANDV